MSAVCREHNFQRLSLVYQQRRWLDVSYAKVLRVGQIGNAKRGCWIAGARLRVAENE